MFGQDEEVNQMSQWNETQAQQQELQQQQQQQQQQQKQLVGGFNPFQKILAKFDHFPK